MGLSLPVLGVPGLLDGRGGLTFLLDFVASDYADDAGPLASPIVARVGQLTLVQVDGQFSYSGGKLVIPAQTTPTWGDLGFYGPATTRAAGVCLYGTLTLSTWEEIGLAWHSAAAAVDPDSANHAIQAHTTDGTLERASGLAIRTGLSLSTEYPIALLLGNAKASLWIRISGAWTLLWQDNAGASTTLYAMLTNLDAVATLGTLRLATLVANAYPVAGTRDLDLCVPGTGTGTSSIATPANGNTFVHTADTLIKYVITTLCTSGADAIAFRSQDGSNEWRVFTYSDGAIALVEAMTSGNLTRAYVGAGTVTNGSTLVIRVLDETIKVYVNGTLQIDYAAAVNFKTMTTGRVAALGGPAPAVWATLTAKALDGIANVGSPNHPGYGLATACLPGPRAAADTFIHEADGMIEFQLDALPSADTVDIAFRQQDATHEWIVRVTTTGALSLIEDNAGETQRATAAGVLVGGERLIVDFRGTTIKGYYNTTLAWTYASATNFATETDGKLTALGTGGRISSLIAWPVTLASATLTPGAASINAALTAMGA